MSWTVEYSYKKKYISKEVIFRVIFYNERTLMAGNLRIMSIFGSTFGPFGGLCNTAESFGPLSKLGKGKHGFLKERERHRESVCAPL